MDILVGVHIGSDWPSGINAALVSLDDRAIKSIIKLSKKAGKHQTVTEYDGTPELGNSSIESLEMDHYKDVAKLGGDPELLLESDVSSPCVMLHVDGTDFWWEGIFKHTDVHWETRMIPLTFLPKKYRTKRLAKATTSAKPDLNMTTEQMNAIHEKIAKGVSQGLNAREIEATFNRHVTKAQLIRCMIELIERGQ